ncbi:MAG TPA: hypothetical protein PKD70_13735 [Saprospiraceae bacterium]|nr:hypothetical protein [Saprospiraceae bacterium]HMP14933.1 hypothetical protein [Saprospiraceae bacterium]
MKHLNVIFFILLVVLCWQCRQKSSQADAISLAQVVLPKDFREVFCPIELGNFESEIIKSRTFLMERGFPSAPEVFPEYPNWKPLDSIYQQQSFDMMSESERRLFRRIGSIVILRNHALLDFPAEKEKIAFYTTEYIEAGGNSAGLLYFCLQALGDYITAAQKKAYAEAVIMQSAEAIKKYEAWLERTKANVNPDEIPMPNNELKEDIANIERIIQMERAYAAKLRAGL